MLTIATHRFHGAITYAPHFSTTSPSAFATAGGIALPCLSCFFEKFCGRIPPFTQLLDPGGVLRTPREIRFGQPALVSPLLDCGGPNIETISDPRQPNMVNRACNDARHGGKLTPKMQIHNRPRV